MSMASLLKYALQQETQLLHKMEWPQWALRAIVWLGSILLILTLLQTLVHPCLPRGINDRRPRKTDEGYITTGEETKTSFRWFQVQYLSVYLIVMLADWLQGPNMFPLYTSYKVDVGTLFICGFASSAIFGTFLGVYVDRWGRKFGCIVFCVLEIIINLLEHVPSMPVLVIGRVLGGISTSLLFSAFESWMVSHHRKQKYPEHFLASTFAISSWGNGVMGCSAGLVAQVSADYGGDIGPFQVAIALTVVALIIILSWEENYGGFGEKIECVDAVDGPCAAARVVVEAEADRLAAEAEEEAAAAANDKAKKGDQPTPTKEAPAQPVTLKQSSILTDLVASARFCVSCKPVLYLGLSQAVFEGAVYTFVFMWSKVLEHSLKTRVPVGLVMTSFMLSMTIGGMFSAFILPFFPGGVEGLSVFTYVVAAAAMCVPVFCFQFEYIFASFLVMEASVGIFYSCGGMLRSKYYPEQQQSSIMNVFRVPLNLLVMLGTKLSDWAEDDESLQRVFMVIVAMHVCAAVLQLAVNMTAPTAKSAKRGKAKSD